MTRWKTAGILFVLAGVAATVTAYFRPFLDPHYIQDGWGMMLSLYEQILPLAGMGFALAQLSMRWRVINLVLLLAGIGAGLYAGEPLVSATIVHYQQFNFVVPMGAICCALTGLCLVSQNRIRLFLLPLTALISGLGFATAITIISADPAETASAVMAVLWVAVSALLLWRLFEQRWFFIAGRILGAWLIAIGIMLGAAEIKPRPPEPTKAPAINLNKV
jgi:hypothetical protein